MQSGSSTPTSEPSLGGRRDPDAQCENCPLNEEDCIFVPSDGPHDADLVIVGEAPGYQEAKVGRPFTGASGKLLDIVLREHGIERSEVRVTNVCLCRPPNNATPPATAIHCCYPRLKRDLEKAKQILALGNTAAQTILGTKDGITKVRVGPGRAAPAFPSATVFPTIHPAACLRQGDMFPSLVTDVGKLTRSAQIKWEPPEWTLFDEPGPAYQALNELRSSRYGATAIDIEVGIDRDEFQRPERYQMLCVGISYAPGKAIVIGEQACQGNQVRIGIRRIADEKNAIYHNGKFDLAGLAAYCGSTGGLWFDTMLASYALDERPGTHSLDYCGVEFLGTPNWKQEFKKYHKKGESYANVARDKLYQYNAFDAAVTYEAKDYFVEELDKHGLRGLHDFLCEAAVELMHAEKDGTKVDPVYNEYLTEHYVEVLEPLVQKLGEVAGWPGFNPNSPKQVQKVLSWADINVDTTNADTLQEIIDKHRKDTEIVEFCQLMLQQRKEQKLYGTYVKGIWKRMYQGRVHPTFLLHGTVSGRLSCRNPNLQNIPRESTIRRQFVPSEGNVFLQGDYGQAELRVMATLSQDKYLHEVFNNPERDLFDELSRTLYGPNCNLKAVRIRTKAYAYGLSYGREEYSIAMEYKIPIREARKGMEAFMGRIPELNAWRKDLMKKILNEQEDLITPFGRHRRFWLITDQNKKDTLKEALSFYPQSIASDICLTATCRLRRSLGDRGGIRIPVHDSILVECREEDADEVAVHMKETMEQTARDVFTDYVPFPVDVERGYSWGELS